MRERVGRERELGIEGEGEEERTDGSKKGRKTSQAVPPKVCI